jgi:hypothetical protein
MMVAEEEVAAAEPLLMLMLLMILTIRHNTFMRFVKAIWLLIRLPVTFCQDPFHQQGYPLVPAQVVLKTFYWSQSCNNLYFHLWDPPSFPIFHTNAFIHHYHQWQSQTQMIWCEIRIPKRRIRYHQFP